MGLGLDKLLMLPLLDARGDAKLPPGLPWGDKIDFWLEESRRSKNVSLYRSTTVRYTLLVPLA
jgi:hypothetical protein